MDSNGKSAENITRDLPSAATEHATGSGEYMPEIVTAMLSMMYCETSFFIFTP